MARLAGALLSAGIVMGLLSAVVFRMQNPRGLLFATPAANHPVYYTPSSVVGFELAMALLIIVCVVFATVAAFIGWRKSHRWAGLSNAACVSAFGFAVLLIAAALTERQWPYCISEWS
jgi:hypothetical protein